MKYMTKIWVCLCLWRINPIFLNSWILYFLCKLKIHSKYMHELLGLVDKWKHAVVCSLKWRLCLFVCIFSAWWRHQMETFSALLALCAGNSPVPVISPDKCQWRGALTSSFICARINGWVNNGEAGDLRCYRVHYDVTVMECLPYPIPHPHINWLVGWTASGTSVPDKTACSTANHHKRNSILVFVL